MKVVDPTQPHNSPADDRAAARRVAACGPLFALNVRSCFERARRGGRYPAGAHTGSVGLAGRLRCDARSPLAPRNSLRSLRSLRSDNRGESDHEARAARVPSVLPRFSPPHKSPPPGTARRAPTLVVFDDKQLGAAGKAVGGQVLARMGGAEQRSLTRGAGRPEAAGRPCTVRVPSAAALRSSVAPARGRVCAAALGRRAAQGTPARRAGAPRLSASACPPAALLARTQAGAHSGHRRTSHKGRKALSDRCAPLTGK